MIARPLFSRFFGLPRIAALLAIIFILGVGKGMAQQANSSNPNELPAVDSTYSGHVLGMPAVPLGLVLPRDTTATFRNWVESPAAHVPWPISRDTSVAAWGNRLPGVIADEPPLVRDTTFTNPGAIEEEVVPILSPLPRDSTHDGPFRGEQSVMATMLEGESLPEASPSDRAHEPDLIVSTGGFSPSSVAHGEELTVIETLKNNGGSAAGASRLEYNLSTNTSLDGSDYALSPNYPNPFNPVTVIRYALPVASTVRLTIFDILVREVRRLVDVPQGPGWYEARYDTSHLGAGLYLYVLEAGEHRQVRRMVLLK